MAVSPEYNDALFLNSVKCLRKVVTDVTEDCALSTVAIDSTTQDLSLHHVANPTIKDNPNEVETRYGDEQENVAADVASIATFRSCPLNEHWCLDSGCSRHMTPEKKDFSRYLEFKIPVTVTLADRTKIHGHGLGDVQIKLFDGNKFIRTVIKNVLFVPKLQRRLLSISDITERGSSVTFKGKKCTLQTQGKTFLFGQRRGKLWQLYCQNEDCLFAYNYKEFQKGSNTSNFIKPVSGAP